MQLPQLPPDRIRFHNEAGFFLEKRGEMVLVRFWVHAKMLAMGMYVNFIGGKWELDEEDGLFLKATENKRRFLIRERCVAEHEWPPKDEKKFWLWVARASNQHLGFDTEEESLAFMKVQVERITITDKLRKETQ